MKRRIYSIMFVALFLLSSLGTVASAKSDPITLRWTNTTQAVANLSFSNGVANCNTVITGVTGVTKITATMTLERKNSNGTYSFEDSWSNLTAYSSFANFTKTTSVDRGVTYRLTVNATVTKGTLNEPVSVSKEAIYN